MRKLSVLYLMFIIYGSLIPFQFRLLDFDFAIARFQDISFLDLGVTSRADWIANILLYVPLGFMGFSILDKEESSSLRRGLCSVIILGGCLFTAAFIEFLQVYTINRTVSLNDVLGEGLGSLIGICMWYFWGGGGRRLLRAFKEGREEAVDAALAIYGLLFLGYSLFPFDFIVSSSELSWKLSIGHHDLFLVDGSFGLRGLVSLGAEVFSVVPLGMLFVRKVGAGKRSSLSAAVLYGGAIGICLEGGQLFLASGYSQGLSVAAKMAGFWLGMELQRALKPWMLSRLRPYVPSMLVLAIVPYLLVLLFLKGWLGMEWIGVGAAMAKLNVNTIIPFYYHYFTSETAALVSLVSNVAVYGLIGAGGYLFCVCSGTRPFGRAGVTLVAALLALSMETGRLFLVGKFPDYTNVLIAGVSVWYAYFLTGRILDWPWFPDMEKGRDFS